MAPQSNLHSGAGDLNNKETMEQRKLIAYCVIGLASAACFAVLMGMVMNVSMTGFDDAIRNSFYAARSPGLNTLVELVTYAGQAPTIVVLCLLLLMYPHTRGLYGIPVAASSVLGQIVKKVIKVIVQRERPDISLHLIEQGGYSFPSGHAIASMAAYGLLFVLIIQYMEKGTKRTCLLIVTGMLSFAVGLSRIYLGVHYPSDVLAGWFGAISVICLVLIGFLIINSKKANNN